MPLTTHKSHHHFKSIPPQPPPLQSMSAQILCSTIKALPHGTPDPTYNTHQFDNITEKDFLFFLSNIQLSTQRLPDKFIQIHNQKPPHSEVLQRRAAMHYYQKQLPSTTQLPKCYYSAIIILSEYSSLADNARNTSLLAAQIRNHIYTQFTHMNSPMTKDCHHIIKSFQISISSLTKQGSFLSKFNSPRLIYSLTPIERSGNFTTPLTSLINYLAREMIDYSASITNLIKTINTTISHTPYLTKTPLQHLQPPKPPQHTSSINNPKKISTTCTRPHNTPSCPNCGWLTSWTKKMSKFGLIIKQAKPHLSTSNTWFI